MAYMRLGHYREATETLRIYLCGGAPGDGRLLCCVSGGYHVNAVRDQHGQRLLLALSLLVRVAFVHGEHYRTRYQERPSLNTTGKVLFREWSPVGIHRVLRRFHRLLCRQRLRRPAEATAPV